MVLNKYNTYKPYRTIKTKLSTQLITPCCIKYINTNSTNNNQKPSLTIIFLETTTEFFFDLDKTPKTAADGIINELNNTLPKEVPSPPEKPVTSFKKNKKNRAINNSGIELATAFIVAPFTPSLKFLPM